MPKEILVYKLIKPLNKNVFYFKLGVFWNKVSITSFMDINLPESFKKNVQPLKALCIISYIKGSLTYVQSNFCFVLLWVYENYVEHFIEYK